jgi:hypothetical protein
VVDKNVTIQGQLLGPRSGCYGGALGVSKRENLCGSLDLPSALLLMGVVGEMP